MAAKPPAVKKTTGNALVTTDFAQEVEDMRARLGKATAGTKVGLENKKFVLPNDNGSFEKLEVIIVDFVYMNKYYSTNYNKDVIVPPDCFALSVAEEDLVASENSPSMQCETGCGACTQNQYGTKGNGKACSNRVLLAILPGNATNDDDFMVIDLPPTSMKNFKGYVKAVGNALRRPPYGVVTTIEHDMNETYAKLIFSDPQPIDDAGQIGMLRSRMQEARDLLLTEPDIAALQAANDAAQPKKSNLKAPVKRRA